MTKTVFITGTTGGIGAASAQLFLKHGWQVIATSREPERMGDWRRSDPHRDHPSIDNTCGVY